MFLVGYLFFFLNTLSVYFFNDCLPYVCKSELCTLKSSVLEINYLMLVYIVYKYECLKGQYVQLHLRVCAKYMNSDPHWGSYPSFWQVHVLYFSINSHSKFKNMLYCTVTVIQDLYMYLLWNIRH